MRWAIQKWITSEDGQPTPSSKYDELNEAHNALQELLSLGGSSTEMEEWDMAMREIEYRFFVKDY